MSKKPENAYQRREKVLKILKGYKVKQEDESTWSLMKKIPVSISIGFGTGILLHKSQLFFPYRVIDGFKPTFDINTLQFVADPSLIRVCLTQLSGLLIFNSISSSLAPEQFEDNRQDSIRPRNLWAVSLGSFLTGAGLTLSGTDPTLTLVPAMIHITGYLTGSLIFSIIQPSLQNWFESSNVIQTRFSSLDRWLRLSFKRIALTLGFSGLAFITISEWYQPWWRFSGSWKSSQFLSMIDSLQIKEILFENVWPPLMTGGLLAFLQGFWTFSFCCPPLQIFSGFSTLLSNLIPTFWQNYFLLQFRNGVSNWLNVGFGMSVISGAIFSANSFSLSRSLQVIKGHGPFSIPPAFPLISSLASSALQAFGLHLSGNANSIQSGAFLSRTFFYGFVPFILGGFLAPMLLRSVYQK